LPDLLAAFTVLTSQADRWLFRGQPDALWGLQPSIERVVVPPQSSPSAVEAFVIYEFKRRAHHYLDHVPASDDELAWLALMRHHGSPSRLLDWTRSPYVAAAFAAFDAGRDRAFAVWAIDQLQLEVDARSEIIERCPELGEALIDKPGDHRNWQSFISSWEYFRKAFFQRRDRMFFVGPVEPYHSSERMTIQQGVFLCGSSLAFSFENLLASRLRRLDSKNYLIRFEVGSCVRAALLAELDRMNVTAATLFPGLDGFARSLRASAEIEGRARAGLSRLLSGDRSPRPPR
jgi:hypothetical protein